MLRGRKGSPLSVCYRFTLRSGIAQHRSASLFLGLVFTAWLRPATYAEAAPLLTEASEQTRNPDPLPTIEIQVIGDDARRQALEDVLGSQHAGRVNIEWTSATRFDPQQLFEIAPAAKAKIRCWINLSDPKLARLYFVAPRQDRFMLRDLPLHRRFGSFEIESVAQIIELSVDALLTNEDAGLSRVQAQAILTPAQPTRTAPPSLQPRPAPRPPAEESVHSVAASVRYELTRYAAGVPLQQGIGGSLAHERQSKVGMLQLAIAAAYLWPVEVANEVASATIRGGSLSLQLSQLWPVDRSRRQYVGVGLTGGLSWLGAKATAGTLPGEYVLQPSEARTLEPFVGPAAVWRLNLARHLSLQLGCLVGWHGSPIRHEVVVNGRKEAVAEGAAFRPSLNLALIVR